MKKVVCILTLCVCLILIGCAPSVPAEEVDAPEWSKGVNGLFHPDLELSAAYSVAPYDQLLPWEIPDGYVVESCLLDGIAPDSSAEKIDLVSVKLQNGKGINLSVRVRKFEEDRIPHSYIADPNDPETYDVIWFSQQSEPYPENYSLEGLFYAKDLTPELIEKRMGRFVSGEVHSTFSVGVVCDEWEVVCHGYLSEEYSGAELISAQQVYDMITSSRYFAK